MRRALLVALAAALACARPLLVPLVPRPDTRLIAAVTVDSAALFDGLALFEAALPREAAVCYEGALRDTVLAGEPRRWLFLRRVLPARADSADETHVYFSGDGAARPCEGTLAVGHSHPAGARCDHSSDDALLLFYHRDVLVSLVWCPSGDLQILFQDGRRGLTRWRAP